MTYIDLPGLTKIPIKGQPENIERQLISLCKIYAENSNTIILALSSSNNDIVNSESLKFAIRIDPKGERTISVITKIDLYDGTDQYLLKLFSQKILKLKMGFVATANDDFENSEHSKENLLKKFPALKKCRNFGKGDLSVKLCKVLSRKINKSIPVIR